MENMINSNINSNNSKKVTKVLWFSRHEFIGRQRTSLEDKFGAITVNHIAGNVKHASEIQDAIDEADISAIVAPIGLQQEFIRASKGKPVIMAVNDRELVPDPEGGEPKAIFHFVKWERIIKIDIVKEDFAS